MTLTEALDVVYGHRGWSNPIRPYVLGPVSQTPYEAYRMLKPEFKIIVRGLIGHEPREQEK